MAEAMLVGAYDEEQVVTPSDGYNPGDIIQAPSSRVGVIQGQRPLEEGEPALAKTTGRYNVASASGTTFSAGVIVGWDDTNKLAVAAGAGDFDIGTSAKAKVSGELVVLVVLNDSVAPVADFETRIAALEAV